MMSSGRWFVPGLLASVLALLAACAAPVAQPLQEARAPMGEAAAPKAPVVVPPQVSDALQVTEAPVAEPAEQRFDLAVNNAQARDVFLAMVTDTRYSMLMHPEVTGTLSVTLRGVTIREALEAIRDVYGYDFKIDGRRITVYPPTLQTRIFTVNYLNLRREGKSDLRVNSGAASVVPRGPAGAGAPGTPAATPAGESQAQAFESSRLSTTSRTDFWADLAEALRGIVGSEKGRNVVVSAQAGVIAVRAMPDELREVDAFLRATRISVERQVMLEAKIVEVQLREGFQSGVDWSILRGRGTAGTMSGSPGNLLINPPTQTLPAGTPPGVPLMPNVSALPILDSVGFPARGSGLFGLVFGTRSFEGVLAFLETQGTTQILSSPRVAALNNQRAVLKVGTDEFFVTGITGGTITSGAISGAVTTLPTITFSTFFSGIALDVMPQVDQGDTITLHVHPSVSSVAEVTKQVDLGGAIGVVRLPLPANSTNETDTVVRVTDGYIVAIGGLMQVTSQGSRSGLPGTGRVPILSSLLGNQQDTSSKREIVVLIKPTIIRSAEDWREQAREAKSRLEEYGSKARHVITLDGPAPAKPR